MPFYISVDKKHTTSLLILGKRKIGIIAFEKEWLKNITRSFTVLRVDPTNSFIIEI